MLITKNVKEENFKQKDKKLGNQSTTKKYFSPKRLLLDRNKKSVFVLQKENCKRKRSFRVFM